MKKTHKFCKGISNLFSFHILMPRCHPVHCHPVHCYAVKCVDDYASDCDPVENKLARNKNDHKNATTANIVHGKSGILKHLVAEKIVA